MKDIKPFEKKVWLASPYMHGDEMKYVREAFDANWITTAGENVNTLEKDMEAYLGTGHAIALSSGTSAGHLAVIDAGVKRDDVVFSSDMTFAATCNPIVYQGAKPVFIDSDRQTWNMDPEALRKAFGKYPDAKAVVVANLYGIPARLDEIASICREHGAVLIEDAAESLGAKFKGRQTGTFGEYGIISFNGNKIITGSTGGMLITDSTEKADHIRKLSTQAREPFPWYQHEEIGYNYRMSNIVAGVARGQLEHLDEHVRMKREIFECYRDGFEGLPVKMYPVSREIEANYWLSCITIDENCGVQPADVIARLAEYNAEARHIWKPMHMQPVYSECDFISADEGADGHGVCGDIFRRGVCLPSDLNMSRQQQESVIEITARMF